MKQKVSAKVDSVDLNKLKYGTHVDIKQYNSASNKYTVPSFGIILVRVISGNAANLQSMLSDGYDIWCSSSGESQNSIIVPVMKGSQIYITGTPNVACFFPITMD